MAEPCPKGDGCALNKGAVTCFHCGRNWPPDETWETAASDLYDAAFRARLLRQGLSSDEMSQFVEVVEKLEAERDRLKRTVARIRDSAGHVSFSEIQEMADDALAGSNVPGRR